MAKSKVKPVRAWGVMICSSANFDAPFDTLCSWVDSTKAEVMKLAGVPLDPSCYKPVRVEIRLVPKRRKAKK